ncbi:MAG: glycosyltransferase [Anaerolineales bacterium]|jgi:sterol 3beta-glucosyltransferase|nr:glycosyltransferase [Anaerolineales bacterium]
MKLVMITIGSRGEIEPCVTLGMALKTEGYEVVVATHPNFRGFIESCGLTFALINIDIDAFLSSDASPTMVKHKNPLGNLASAFVSMNTMYRQIGDDSWAAAKGAEALFYTIGGSLLVPHLVEKLNIPAIGLYPYPAGTPTSAFPNALVPMRNLGSGLNKLSHQLSDLGWLAVQKPIRDWRVETLGLSANVGAAVKKFRSTRPPILYGFSKHVLPPPADWGDEAIVSGYWFFPERAAWQPDSDLVAFLQAGPPPVYVGFGSMRLPNAGQTTQIVVEALRQTGQRGLLLSGNGGLLDVKEHGIHTFSGAPFSWLFPQMSALIHHGGSGTTALGIRAGVPATAIPFMMDQPFWGRRLAALGVGWHPIPIKQLTRDKLAAAIEIMVQDAAMRGKAKALSKKILSENGTAEAAAWIKRILAKS